MSEYLKKLQEDYDNKTISRYKFDSLSGDYYKAIDKEKERLNKSVVIKINYLDKIKDDLKNNKISVDEFITANDNYQNLIMKMKNLN